MRPLSHPTFAHVVSGPRQVGSIVFTAEEGKSYAKGDELGYFAFGGSTVITLFGNDALVVDQDLLHNRCAQRKPKTVSAGRLPL